MTYLIFDGSGNLLDAFTDRTAAFDCLAGMAGAEPESTSEVFLIAQDDNGDTVYMSVRLSACLSHVIATLVVGKRVRRPSMAGSPLALVAQSAVATGRPRRGAAQHTTAGRR
jgi:hypothetical protein